MKVVDVLKADAEYAFGEVEKALDGVTQSQAWAVLPNLGPDYLHTDGSIHGLVHHLAGMKKMHASTCFRDSEFRWRDLYTFTQTIEPDWEKALQFLRDAHQYWMESWAHLTDEDLEDIRPTNWSSDRSALEIIRIANQHDSYHAGQIAVLRYGVSETNDHPPSIAEDILKYCRELKHW